ncbi:MAG: hypothetical protein ACFCVC_04375 [Acidimicrobiia bacterium]
MIDVLIDAALIAAGGLILTWPANLAVRWVLGRARAHVGPPVGAGRWIGVLERLLIFVLVVMGEAGAAGLVVAAKSILRYPEISGKTPTINPEYVLVGSLTSWLLAFAVGGGVVAALG